MLLTLRRRSCDCLFETWIETTTLFCSWNLTFIDKKIKLKYSLNQMFNCTTAALHLVSDATKHINVKYIHFIQAYEPQRFMSYPTILWIFMKH